MAAENPTDTLLPAQFQAGEFVFHLRLNYALGLAIRSQLGLDFINFHNGEAIRKLHFEPEKLFDALELLLAEQLRQHQLDRDAFLTLFDGDAFENAFHALEEMVTNFTPPARRPVMVKLLQRINEIQTKQTDQALSKLSGPQTDQLIERAMQQTSQQIDERLSATLGKTLSGSTSSPPASS